MALFGIKKDKKEKVEAKKPAVVKSAPKKKEVSAVPAVIPTANLSAVSTDAIVRPRITEKSGLLSQVGVYTFEISQNANKNAVAKAVSSLYKVTPTKVAIINLPSKNVFVRGKRGVVAGKRKAVVTLKKGEKIDFV